MSSCVQVNLKEQGQLVRQDEFTIWLGRRKCQRHVFLFEDLILFSKPKRIEGGFDVYIYKRSFKVRAVLQLPLVWEVSMAGFPMAHASEMGRRGTLQKSCTHHFYATKPCSEARRGYFTH